MTLTFDAGTYDVYRYCVIVDKVTGEAGSPIGGIATGSDADGDGSASITLNATPLSSSYLFAMAMRVESSDGSGITVGTGWTEEGELVESGWAAFHVQRRTGTTSTTVTWDDLSTGGGVNVGAAMLAFEIK